MRIGVHVKVAGGHDAAIAYAKRIGCTTLQFFSGNPRAFRTGPIDRPALERFRDLRRAADLAPVVIHTSYLINLASEDDKLAANSLRLLENDLAVAAAGEVRYVNTHLGSFGSGDRAAGFVRVCRALEAALEHIAPDVYLVLENSAGAGKLCGGTIDELGAFVKTVGHPQLAVCLDTAHSWAAGYDIHDAAGVEQFLALADEHIGLDKVVLFHFNDTQIPLGGHRDRHWHIGEGMIGFDGFRALVSHAKVREKVAILETPGEEADDQRNMQAIRGLLAAVAA
jgi:deoxyribonuclease-4